MQKAFPIRQNFPGPHFPSEYHTLVNCFSIECSTSLESTLKNPNGVQFPISRPWHSRQGIESMACGFIWRVCSVLDDCLSAHTIQFRVTKSRGMGKSTQQTDCDFRGHSMQLQVGERSISSVYIGRHVGQRMCRPTNQCNLLCIRGNI